jgi:predicted site-specific integrase-resolvase
MKKKFITRKQAAELLSVTTMSIHNYTKKGYITKYKKFGRIFYDKEELLCQIHEIK